MSKTKPEAKPEIILFLSDARGVYIPRDFAEEIRPECLSGVDPEDLEILKAGPNHEWYWEAWTNVLDSAVVTDPDTGVRYSVHQDGDCWLIPEGMEWDDAEGFFRWPNAETETEE